MGSTFAVSRPCLFLRVIASTDCVYNADQSNPESIEDLVRLVVPELQRRGVYWDEYPVVGGTLRENMQHRPRQPLAAADHPAAKLRWDQVKSVKDVKSDAASGSEKPVSAGKSILEISRHRLVTGIKPDDSALRTALEQIRQTSDGQCALYTAIEEPDIIFLLHFRPAMDEASASQAACVIAPFGTEE